MKEIGSKIKYYRDKKGYSQDYMATMLNIAQSTYAKYENDSTEITLKRLSQISKILEEDISSFLVDDSKVINISHNKDNSVNGYIIDNKSINDKLIETLETQNLHLKEEIIFLKNLLLKKT